MIIVVSLDFGTELKQGRGRIVQMLYASTSSPSGHSRNCDFGAGMIDNGHELKENIHQGKPRAGGVATGSPSTTLMSIHGDEEDEDDELDPYAGLFDDEQKKVLEIKQQLEDLDQLEDYLVDLL